MRQTPMRRTALLCVLSLSSAPSVFSQNPENQHYEVYRKIRPSIVGVRAFATFGDRNGTGVIVSADGLIVTSSAVVPAGAENVRVWLSGPRQRQAAVVASWPDVELTLLKIPDRDLAPLPFGDAAALRPGDLVYSVGNVFDSLLNDDQPALQLGVVSGLYTLRATRQGSDYKGPVIETTAAVNPDSQGGPLVNGAGEMVGLLTLNYSPSRWLGVAVPAGAIQDALAEHLQKPGSADPAGNPAAANPVAGGLGVTVKADPGGLAVAAVEKGSPAARAGIEPDDVIVAVGEKPAGSPADFETWAKSLQTGSIVRLSVKVGGEGSPVRVEITIGSTGR